MRHLRFPILFLALALLFSSLPARKARALDRLIEVLAVGVTDSTGEPVAAGTVTFYDAGTTNLRTVYQDFALSTPAANPATMDNAGRLILYTDKRVKLLIKDSLGSTVRTIDNVGTADSDVASSAISGGAAIVFPVGAMMPYAGGSPAPSGWLICNGTQYSQVQYAALYAIIGTNYNTGGETAGYFRVPDQARRTLVGAGGSGTATLANTIGSRGGEETHTLTGGESGIQDHLHGLGSIGVTVGSAGAHTHSYSFGEAKTGPDDQTITTTMIGFGFDHFQSTGNPAGTAEGAHSHSASLTGTMAATGNITAVTAHNNMQPSLVVNYIIKY